MSPGTKGSASMRRCLMLPSSAAKRRVFMYGWAFTAAAAARASLSMSTPGPSSNRIGIL